MRALLIALLLLASAPAWSTQGSGTTEHQRGEFRFHTGPAPGFVQARDVPEAWPDAPDEEPWRTWLVDHQVDLRDGRYALYEDLAYQPLSTELVGEAARLDVNFSPDFQRLVLHRVALRRDGRWLDRLDPAKVSLVRREKRFEQDLADGTIAALLVLEDVQVGDVVRVTYTVEGSNPVMAGSLAEGFTLAWNAPSLVRAGRAVFDRDAEVALRWRGEPRPLKRGRDGGSQVVSFEYRNIPAVLNPGDIPSWFNPYPRLQLARERSWADVVAWALPLYPNSPALPAELEQRLAAWQSLPPLARAGAALQLMQEDVRYFGIEMGDNTHRPQPPDVVWARRYGDCKDKTYLLVQMLRRMGLEAEPALVSTRLGRALADELPAASAFNHVIVRLRHEGKSYWLDPTLTGQRGDIGGRDLHDYGLALPVVAGADALVPVQAPEGVRNEVVVVEHFVPDQDGKAVELRVQTTYRGDRADDVRRSLQARRPEQVARNSIDYHRKRFGELTVVDPLSVTEDEAENILVVHERYRLEDPLEPSGRTRTLAAYAEGLTSGTSLPDRVERDAPIGLPRPATLRHEILVDLPEGWVLENLPGKKAIQGGPTSYTRQLDLDNRRARLVHELQLASDHVPAGQASEYVRGLREMREAMGLKLQLGAPTELRDSNRDRRLKALLRGALEDKEE
ncbi:hypothetical protein GCM10011521_01950 [Arenimonas soli]|uniref:DUF3857 domain-containing protein n=1 Tax=Arenimonas soli TaxID=2269504 RepID=A0ABQ1HB09_9GAMM|nr:DUF3857 domain-containing transglutaminase family protein [Arenimonas soli]GGA67440.1 hypothetical protein GCM10011521_01950 [Arenimonas soli]